MTGFILTMLGIAIVSGILGAVAGCAVNLIIYRG